MKSTIAALALSSTLLLAGCVDVPLGSLPDTQTVANGGATLEVTPQVVAGGYTTLAPDPAFDVHKYGEGDIHTVVVQLFKIPSVGADPATESAVKTTGGADVLKPIPRANLASPISFTNLHANTVYRVRAFAYRAEPFDSTTLISTTDSHSYIDVLVGTNERPTVADLKVRLKDKPFNGQATASAIIVTEGGLETTAPEAIH